MVVQPLSKEILKGSLTPGAYVCHIPDVGVTYFEKVKEIKSHNK